MARAKPRTRRPDNASRSPARSRVRVPARGPGTSRVKATTRRLAPRPPAWRPPPGLRIAGGLWLVVLIAWAGGGIGSFGEAAFFLVAAGASAYVTTLGVSLTHGQPRLAAARRVVLLAVVALTPVVFGPAAYQGWDSVKIVVIAGGASLVVGLWAVQLAGGGTRPRLRNGLHWPVLAFVAWIGVCTLTSVSPVISVVGHYDYFDGLALVVCAAILFFAAAAEFDPADIPTVLSALYLGAGGVAVFYGLLQLHDRIIGGRWDWIGGSVDVNQSLDVNRVIWSTFGNPNHLSGFLVIMLPLGLMLALLTRSLRTWLAIAAVGAGLAVELLQSTTRGAWLAATVALALMGVLLVRQRALRLRTAISAGATGAVVLVALLALLDLTGQTRYRVSSLASSSGGATSSAAERVELWRAAAKMAAGHPIVGTGPETYQEELARYQSAKLVNSLGPESNPDGPHNIFLEYLATAGAPGLVLFVALLGAVAWVVRRAGLHVVADAGAAPVHADHQRRVLVAGVTASLVAFVIQATFNVQRVELTALFFILVGLLVVLVGAPAPERARLTPGSRPSQARRSRAGPDRVGAQLGVGALAAVLVIATVATVARPYLGAVALVRAVRSERALKTSIQSRSAPVVTSSYRAADAQFRHATDLDPVDPLFLEARADFLIVWLPAPSALDAPVRLSALRTADDLLRRAAALSPNGRLYAARARVVSLEASETHNIALGNEALPLLRRAVALNPHVGIYAVSLSLALLDAGAAPEAMAVVQRALTYSPTDTVLLAAKQRLASAQRPASPPLNILPVVAI